MADLPIACSLDGEALAVRCDELSRSVLAEASRLEPLPNGLRWHFASSANLLTQLAKLVDGERECCRFLTVTIQAEANLGEVTLDVTGPTGAREFLEGWMRR